MFGRPIRVGIPGDPPLTPSDVQPYRVAYYRWVSTELKWLHAAVKEAREEQKLQDKQMYDKAHKATPPTLQVNNRIWLYDNVVKAGSPKMVTRQRYMGPYVIQNIVKGRPDVGPAYQLFDEKTRKTLKNLATHDRLKLCNVDRDKFSERLTRMVSEKKVPERLHQRTRGTSSHWK